MTTTLNTGDWFPLGQNSNNFFRKFEIYSMDWLQNADLEHMNVYGAPYGGPIAITKDPNSFMQVTTSTKPVIKIFTCSGFPISTIEWKGKKIITIGWSNAEELLIISENGLVTSYDLFGNYKHAFSMGQEVQDTKIIDAKIYPSCSGTGVAVMTSKFRIFVVNNIVKQRSIQFPDALNPSCWEIITENRTPSSIVIRDKEIFKLNQGTTTPISLNMKNDYKTIIKIGLSFNHKHIALYTNTGNVWMGSSDLKKTYCELQTRQTETPKEIAWVMDSETYESSEAVVIAYNSFLLVIGVSCEIEQFYYDNGIFLIPEMDGVRVLSNGSHEMIQKIPKCVNDIYAVSSVLNDSSSSFLSVAYKEFIEKSHKCDDYLLYVKDRLNVVVEEYIDAACYEFDTKTQKHLIRAANFGKGFIQSYNPTDYIKKCRFLRVLNAVRHSKIGIPLTYSQFNHLKPNVLLDRLVFRKHYGLAIQIAKHLKLSESRILKHWAFYKVIHDKNDREIVKKISEKLKNPLEQNVRFCEIAKKAEEHGRRDLAIMLLELETQPSAQVPLLLKVGENKKALSAATNSGDTDLVYMVLLELKEHTQLADFLMIIRSFSVAQNLYKKYCMMYSISALKDIYNQEDDFLSQAQFTLRECLMNENLESSLSIIGSLYKKAQKTIEADLCDETKKIIKLQKILNEKSVQSFSSLSVHDTVKELLMNGDIKTADKLKNEYKIPDRRYWWLRIQVLSANFQWDELEKFSKIKKSPIGYEPFVEMCLKKGNVAEAKKYINKCHDDQKSKLFLKAGLIEEAALIMYDQKDIQSLWNIHNIVSKTPNTALEHKIENLITNLSSKK